MTLRVVEQIAIKFIVSVAQLLSKLTAMSEFNEMIDVKRGTGDKGLCTALCMHCSKGEVGNCGNGIKVVQIGSKCIDAGRQRLTDQSSCESDLPTATATSPLPNL